MNRSGHRQFNDEIQILEFMIHRSRVCVSVSTCTNPTPTQPTNLAQLLQHTQTGAACEKSDQQSSQQKVIQLKPANTDKYENYMRTMSVNPNWSEKKCLCGCVCACMYKPLCECPHMQDCVADTKLEILSAVVCV